MPRVGYPRWENLKIFGVNRLKMFIDRFEGDIVVLEYESKTYNLPIAFLPSGAKEGDLIILSGVIDEAGTKAQAEKIKNLTDDLFED